uniref:Laccase n=1 Tax=Chenopodium quinoa TaxID=63459 RepID=A0A803M5B3_CHEQI
MNVMEIDAVYVKPFTTKSILIAPGQTTNMLVRANQTPNRYFMATRTFMDVPIPVDNKTATSIFQYKGVPNTIIPSLPQLPSPNDTSFALSYNRKLRSLNTPQFPAKDTNLLSVESHPFHLHGYNFFVVGTGVGNFDPIKDAAKFNLVDPPERNTVGVPTGGWTSIRFRVDNPGVWFMHCHLELHTGWGLKIAFMVEDGPGPEYSVLPPPKDLPHC